MVINFYCFTGGNTLLVGRKIAETLSVR